MRVLVTGGVGFIGSHLVDACLRRGDEVRVLDNLQARVHPGGLPPHAAAWERAGAVEIIAGDARNRLVWERALRGVEVVFHQAAYHDYMPDFSAFLSTNAVATALLFEVLVEQRWEVRKVVIASSQAVYGEGQYRCAEHGFFQPPARQRAQLDRGDWEVRCAACGEPAEALCLEERYHNPSSAYAISKLAAELIALRIGRRHDIPTVALRYSITQGPRDSLVNGCSGVCRAFSLRLLAGEPPLIYEDGLQRRDYVHVGDVVAANLAVLDAPAADYEAFNVGGGRAVTVREYADALARAFGRGDTRPVIPGEYRLGDNRHGVSSVAKLRALGWRPRKTLDDIVTDHVAWVRAHGDVGPHVRDADRAMRRLGVVRRAAAAGG
jgi:dTDP-L-rhamnose 4-epimerase